MSVTSSNRGQRLRRCRWRRAASGLAERLAAGRVTDLHEISKTYGRTALDLGEWQTVTIMSG